MYKKLKNTWIPDDLARVSKRINISRPLLPTVPTVQTVPTVDRQTNVVKLEITTGDRFFSGTDDRVGILFPGTVISSKFPGKSINALYVSDLRSLNQPLDEFERSDVNTFFIADDVNEDGTPAKYELTRNTIRNFIIAKIPRTVWDSGPGVEYISRVSDDWFLARVRLWLNGVLMYDVRPNKWLTLDDQAWESPN